MRVSVSVTGRWCGAPEPRSPMCDDEPAVTMKMSALDVGPPRRPLRLDTRMSTCEPDASNLLISSPNYGVPRTVLVLRRGVAGAACVWGESRDQRRCHVGKCRHGVRVRHPLIIQTPGGGYLWAHKVVLGTLDTRC